MSDEKKSRKAKGEGSLYFDKTRNYWRASMTLPDGKRKDFCSKSKVKALAKRNNYMCNHKEELKISEKTIVDCCKEYIEFFFSQGKFKENTYRTHLETLKRLEKSNLKDLSASVVSVFDINNFIADEVKAGKSKSIIYKDRLMLKWGFKYALEFGYATKNPMKSIFLNKNLSEAKDEHVEALTTKEQAKFLSCIEQQKQYYQPFANIWLFALLTGMRVGEICALKIEDIDLNNKKIYINKTITRDYLGILKLGDTTKTKKGTRTIEVSGITEDFIKNLINKKNTNTNFLFSNEDGNFIRPSEVTRKLRDFNNKNHIATKLTSHMLRHTFATRLIEQGLPAKAVQHLLGHSSIDITLDTYTSFFEEQKRKYTEEINTYWEKAIKTN